MPREPLFPPGTRAGGPYSPAVIASGRMLYVASQGPVDPATGAIVGGGSFEAEARQTLSNLQRVVEGSGGSLANAVKVTVFLRDFATFAAFNEVYVSFFPEPRPARTTIQSNIPYGVSVDVIVALDA
jgi:2-iminobutanoate/2-iminopropanoate deaminase